MKILIDIITAIPFAILAYFLIKGFIKLDKQANEANELYKKEKQLQIENLMLEKEIKKEMKKQIENTKNNEEMDYFLEFLKRQEKRIEKEIENVLEREDED